MQACWPYDGYRTTDDHPHPRFGFAMFLADHRFRFEFPAGLSEAFDDASYFSVIEATLNRPIWAFHGLSRVPDTDGLRRTRRILFAALEPALSLLQDECWEWVQLYILWSPGGAAHPCLELARCHSIWQCDEPEDQGTCWRVKTESGVMLQSPLGTELGEERNATLTWSMDSQL